MPLNLASPGILVREVDLTLGRIDPTTDKIGGIVGVLLHKTLSELQLLLIRRTIYLTILVNHIVLTNSMKHG